VTFGHTQLFQSKNQKVSNALTVVSCIRAEGIKLQSAIGGETRYKLGGGNGAAPRHIGEHWAWTNLNDCEQGPLFGE
jgi:hypothetical protein